MHARRKAVVTLAVVKGHVMTESASATRDLRAGTAANASAKTNVLDTAVAKLMESAIVWPVGPTPTVHGETAPATAPATESVSTGDAHAKTAGQDRRAMPRRVAPSAWRVHVSMASASASKGGLEITARVRSAPVTAAGTVRATRVPVLVCVCPAGPVTHVPNESVSLGASRESA